MFREMCEYSESEGNDSFTKWAFLKEIMVMVLKAKREGEKVAVFRFCSVHKTFSHELFYINSACCSVLLLLCLHIIFSLRLKLHRNTYCQPMANLIVSEVYHADVLSFLFARAGILRVVRRGRAIEIKIPEVIVLCVTMIVNVS